MPVWLRMTTPAPFCRPHAFVVMPFGQKHTPEGTSIDFNRVYGELIAPALLQAGLEPFRADQELRAGDIRTDMFQELLLADLVVADLTIDNPNVWYELGVRHALRARGVVLISGGRVSTAFDLYTDRKLRYGLRDGVPDPSTVLEDRQALASMVTSTMECWHGRRISPVYALLPHLQEPSWDQLRVGAVCEFWSKFDTWQDRIALARKGGQLGNILVLADEAPVAAFRAKAWFEAGYALLKAEEFCFALEQLERGLAVEPDNLKALRDKGICLQRLGQAGRNGYSSDRALTHVDRLLSAHPDDAESWALAGRVLMDDWVASWNRQESSLEQKREEAVETLELLWTAQQRYLRGFRTDPTNFYAGLNALCLLQLAAHLSNDPSEEPSADASVATLAGAVRFAAESAALDLQGPESFWALTTLADLEVLTGPAAAVKAAYRKAIAQRQMDRFAMASCRARLLLLQQLGFRAEAVAAALSSLDGALSRCAAQQPSRPPRRVLLFSGHMIDAPNRATPRFPATLEAAASERIEAVLTGLGAGPDDLAFCQAAAGGDLLFLEACQRRQVQCQVMLPFDEPSFIQKSILPSTDGDHWRERYFAMKEQLGLPMLIMPEQLGPAPEGRNVYERCNDWLLYSAMVCGLERLHFICLWDGQGGDGRGGTAHMVQELESRSGRVSWIDTRQLATG